MDESVDVGATVRKGEDIQVKLFTGSSVLSPGSLTDNVETIGTLLSPLAQEEVGTIRCIGLNVSLIDGIRPLRVVFVNGCFSTSNMLTRWVWHIPQSLPFFCTPSSYTIFLPYHLTKTRKPATCLADPWPAPTIIPKFAIPDNCADYEAELAVIIGKTCKNVPESEALNYVLGYTAANDVSSRKTQFSSTQWCFSKGFDGSCPIGPVLVTGINPRTLTLKGSRNGKIVQNCGLEYVI